MPGLAHLITIKKFVRCLDETSTSAESSVTRLGYLLHSKPVATIILPKLPTVVGNFCKGVKIFHFSSKIIIRQLL